MTISDATASRDQSRPWERGEAKTGLVEEPSWALVGLAAGQFQSEQTFEDQVIGFCCNFEFLAKSASGAYKACASSYFFDSKNPPFLQQNCNLVRTNMLQRDSLRFHGRAFKPASFWAEAFAQPARCKGTTLVTRPSAMSCSSIRRLPSSFQASRIGPSY